MPLSLPKMNNNQTLRHPSDLPDNEEKAATLSKTEAEGSLTMGVVSGIGTSPLITSTQGPGWGGLTLALESQILLQRVEF